MLDVAISIAGYAKVRAWLPTIEIKSSFLEPLPIGTCVGEGRVLKVGKNLAIVPRTYLVHSEHGDATLSPSEATL